MDQTPFHQDLLQGKAKMDEQIAQHQTLQNQVLVFAFFGIYGPGKFFFAM